MVDNIKTGYTNHDTLSSSASSSSISVLSIYSNSSFENIKVVLPNGMETMKKINLSKAIYDVFIEILASEKLQPSSYTLQLFNNEMKLLDFTPNQLTLNINPSVIKIIPKKATLQSNMTTIVDCKSKTKSTGFMKHGHKPVNNTPIFESINLIKINLPHNQKSAIRVSLDTKLNSLFELICAENGFDQTKYKLSIRNEKFLNEHDLNKPLSYYQTNEIYMSYSNDEDNVSTGFSKMTKNKSKSTTNLVFDENNNNGNYIADTLNKRKDKSEKPKTMGILGLLMRKRSKSRTSMTDENNRNITPNSETRESPKVVHDNRNVLLNYNLNGNNSFHHFTKKKQAPAPPSQIAQIITRQASNNSTTTTTTTNQKQTTSTDNSDSSDRISISTLLSTKKKQAPAPPAPPRSTSMSTPTSPSLPTKTTGVPESLTQPLNSFTPVDTIDNNTNAINDFDHVEIVIKPLDKTMRSTSSSTSLSLSNSSSSIKNNVIGSDGCFNVKQDVDVFQPSVHVEPDIQVSPISSRHSSSEDLSKSFASVIKEAERYIAAAIVNKDTQTKPNLQSKIQPTLSMAHEPVEHPKIAVNDQHANNSIGLTVDKNDSDHPSSNPSDSDNSKKSNGTDNFILSKKRSVNQPVLKDLCVDSDSHDERDADDDASSLYITLNDQEKFVFTPKIDNHETYKVVRSADVIEKNGTYYSYDGTVRGHMGSVKKMTNSKRLSDIFTIGTKQETTNNDTVSINGLSNPTDSIPNGNLSRIQSATTTVATKSKDEQSAITTDQILSGQTKQSFKPNPADQEENKNKTTKPVLTPTTTSLNKNQAKPVIDNIRTQIINNRKSLASIINDEKKAVQLKKQVYQESVDKQIGLAANDAPKSINMPVKPSESFVISAKTKNLIGLNPSKTDDSKPISTIEKRPSVLKQIMSTIPNAEQVVHMQTEQAEPFSNVKIESAKIPGPKIDQSSTGFLTSAKPVNSPQHSISDKCMQDENKKAQFMQQQKQREPNLNLKSLNRNTNGANPSVPPPPITPKLFNLKPINNENSNKLKSAQALSMYSNRSNLLDSIKSFNHASLRKAQLNSDE